MDDQGNVSGPGMTTARLSDRQDLVEGLDPEAVRVYLSRHGVLDPVVLADLDVATTSTQRNSAILGHIEQQGSAAVTLLISALRQSWQLQLASSLDTERRIKSLPGNIYLGTYRHKGQITIKIQPEALKLRVRNQGQPERLDNPSQVKLPVLSSGVTQDCDGSVQVTGGVQSRERTRGARSIDGTNDVRDGTSVHGRNITDDVRRRDFTDGVHSRDGVNVHDRDGTSVHDGDDAGRVRQPSPTNGHGKYGTDGVQSRHIKDDVRSENDTDTYNRNGIHGRIGVHGTDGVGIHDKDGKGDVRNRGGTSGYGRDGRGGVRRGGDTDGVHGRDGKSVHGHFTTGDVRNRGGTGDVRSRGGKNGHGKHSTDGVHGRNNIGDVSNRDDVHFGGSTHSGKDAPESVHDIDEAGEKDVVKPRSCWCLCLPFKRTSKNKSHKTKQKHISDSKHQTLYQTSTTNADPSLPRENNSKIYTVKQPKEKPQKKHSKRKRKGDLTEVDIPLDSQTNPTTDDKQTKTRSSKVSCKYLTSDATDGLAVSEAWETKAEEQTNLMFKKDKTVTIEMGPEYVFPGRSQPDTPERLQMSDKTIRYKEGAKYVVPTEEQQPVSENLRPIVVRYEPKSESIKVVDIQERSLPKVRPESTSLQWVSEGQQFLHKASLYCDKVIAEFSTDLTKYFEQDRGTLVLDLASNDCAVCVTSICMMRTHVMRLEEDVPDGKLIRRIEGMFSSLDTVKLGIHGVRLKVSLDETELITALTELS